MGTLPGLLFHTQNRTTTSRLTPEAFRSINLLALVKKKNFHLHVRPLESEIFGGLIILPVPSKTEKTPSIPSLHSCSVRLLPRETWVGSGRRGQSRSDHAPKGHSRAEQEEVDIRVPVSCVWPHSAALTARPARQPRTQPPSEVSPPTRRQQPGRVHSLAHTSAPVLGASLLRLMDAPGILRTPTYQPHWGG